MCVARRNTLDIKSYKQLVQERGRPYYVATIEVSDSVKFQPKTPKKAKEYVSLLIELYKNNGSLSRVGNDSSLSGHFTLPEVSTCTIGPKLAVVLLR